jgi:integrase
MLVTSLEGRGLHGRHSSTERSVTRVFWPKRVIDRLPSSTSLLERSIAESAATATGEWLRPEYVTRLFKRLVAEAELPWIHPHGTRHTRASIALQNGIDIVSTRGEDDDCWEKDHDGSFQHDHS